MTLGEDCFGDRGPAVSVTERCVMGVEGEWFFLLGALSFFATVCSTDIVDERGVLTDSVRVGV